MKHSLLSLKSLFTAMALLLGSLSMLHAQSANKPMSGTYTIAYENADFEDIRSAIDSLMKNGVNGPVKMLIKNGTYNSLAFHDSIPGSSAKNTVTFRSATGQRDSVRIYDTYGAKLANTCHLRFEQLTLEGIVVGVEMDSSVSDVEIRHCNINTQMTNNYLYKGIEYPGNATTLNRRLCNVRIIANKIRGGYVNIYLNNYCNSNDFNNTGFIGVIIDSNILCDACYYGFYSKQNGIVSSFSHNTVTNYPDYKYYGVISESKHHWGRVDGNRIHINNSQAGYGLYFNISANEQNKIPTVVCNNEIILGDSSAKYGIFLGGAKGAFEIINNSILIKSPTLSYGLNLGNTDTAYKVVSYNNMVVNGKNDGYPVYIANVSFANTKYYKRDYNNYYSEGNYLAYLGSKKSTLQEIKNADTLSEQHSTSIAPVWVDSKLSLEYKNTNNYTCPTLPNVTTDINGRPRLGDMNAMGCYTKDVDSNDASLIGFADLDKMLSGSASPVKAVIMNAGKKAISSASITLWIDNVKKAAVKYTPAKPLPFQQTDTVNLGSFQLSSGLHHFLACVQMDKDTTAGNDSIRISRHICEKPMEGTIVIGNSKSADYPFWEINTLLKKLNECGVKGDITLAFEDGTYDGSIDLATIASTMRSYKMTLTSKSKNREKVTIRDSISSNFILNIGEGNRNITVEHLTFKRTADTSFTCISMTGCDNILIRNNRLLMDTNTQKGCSLIHATYSKGNVNGLTIKNNLLQGGNWGIYINGAGQTSMCNNIVVDSNELIGQNGPATYFQYTYAKSISHNVMLSRKYNGNPGYFRGIYISYAQVDSIIGNWIDGSRDTKNQMPAQGMYLNYLNYYSGTTTLVANNCIQAKIIGGYPAIQLSYSSAKLYHNTIRTTCATPNSTNTNKGYGIYVSNAAKEENHICGNIIDANKAEFALYVILSNNSKQCITDYNCYCNTDGVYLAYFNGKQFRTVKDICANMKSDTHSIQLKPTFNDLDKNMEIAALPQLLMPRLNSVPRDFSNRTRPAQTLMGACESDPGKNDAALSDFGKTNLVRGSQSPVYVSLMNMGSGTLTSATIRWTFNGTNQSAANWSGSLASRASTEVLLGKIVPNAYNELKVWVEKPNAGSDANHANDTILFNTYLCNGPLAAGTYTLGGYNPDFKDAEALTTALYQCGIAGPVVVKVRTGSYGSLKLKDSVPGSSSSNTLTIVAEKGDSPLFDGGSSDAGLDINNLKYTTFKGLTFGNLTDGLMGVKMDGHCSHVTIRNCRIYACTTSTTTDYKALSYIQSESSNYPEGVQLRANQITGGYYNLYLYHIAGNSTNITKSTMYIDSNTLTEANCYGIYSYYYGGFPSISHNTIRSRDTNTNADGGYYGIYCYGYKNIGKVEGNRIFACTKLWAYGLYIGYYHNVSNNVKHYAMICNNEVRAYGKTAVYGLMINAGYSRMDIHHNSIHVKSEQNTAYGILLNPSNNDQYKTNISRNLSVAEGFTRYPLYIQGSSFSKTRGLREWNNLYSDTCVGYAYKFLKTIADLQSVTSQDSHSLSILPPFTNIANGLELKSYDTLHCPRLDSVLTDIDGHRRNVRTNIGCHADPVFLNEYLVKLHVNDTSMGKTTGAGSYTDGTRVKLSATPKDHHHFVRWNDGNKENPRYITLKKDTAFTAIFGLDTHKVILLSNDTSLGKVTGDGLYAYGSVATLTASPKAGNSFKQWSDNNKTNPRQITVTADVTLTAIFVSGDGIAERLPDGMAVYSNDMCIYVKGAEGKAVSIFNTAGQLLLQNVANGSPEQFRMPAKGVYYVKIGSCHPVKVVVF